jgi:hypothetical protein
MQRHEIGESPLSKNITIPEKITERKIIVYKSRIDIKAVRATAEKMKTQLFRKLVFLKPKPKEVQIVSINKYFEPYVIVDGEYSIDYSKNWIHNIQVDETMQELTIFGEKVRPKSLKGHLEIPCKILQLTGEGRFKHEAKAHIIFDKQWREVGLEQLPLVPFEEQPEKILSNLDQEFGNAEMATEKEVEILKSRIVQRPSEILCIYEELFKVSERAVIFKPMYKVTVRNFKTKKEIAMIIDAITGKTTSAMQYIPARREKETIREPAKPSSSAKTAADNVSSPVKKTENKVESKLKV